MDRHRLPLNALRAFEATGRLLSVTAAAKSLFVSQSAVSRHVMMLESALATQLFHRKHHQLELTGPGKALLAVVTRSFDPIQATLSEIIQFGHVAPRVLRLTLPSTFAHNLAMPLLRDFRLAHPELMLEMTEQKHGATLTPDSDIAIIYSKPEVHDQDADLLWQARLTPMCHPALLAEQQAGLSTLLMRNEVVHVKLHGEDRHRLWSRFIHQERMPAHTLRHGMEFETASLAAKYVSAGHGIALLDPRLFQRELAAGLLVQAHDAWLDDGYGYYVLSRSDHPDAAAVATLRKEILQRFTPESPRPS